MGEDRARIDEVFRRRSHLAERYSLENAGNRFNFNRLHERISYYLHSLFEDLPDRRFLDLGAGGLFWTEQIMRMGLIPENCVGCDLLQWRLAEGRRLGREVAGVVASAGALPFGPGIFDLVSLLTLMTSVTDKSQRQKIATEIKRVLRPGGYVFWYDFRYNNPFNRYTRAIGKREIEALFGDWPIRYESLTLLPPLARKLGGKLPLLLNSLHALPILRSHYLAIIGPKG